MKKSPLAYGEIALENDAPAYRAIAREIERQLSAGELNEGDALPNETELAARFDVNRSTIRESIRLLEDSGYIHRISPRKIVASIPSAAFLARRTTRALCISKTTLREVWEANLAIEPAMARAAAHRASEAQKRALKENVAATVECVANNEPLADLDEEFHRLLGEASNHSALQIAREPFSNLFLQVVDGLVHDLSVGDRLLMSHQRILPSVEVDTHSVPDLPTVSQYMS